MKSDSIHISGARILSNAEVALVAGGKKSTSPDNPDRGPVDEMVDRDHSVPLVPDGSILQDPNRVYKDVDGDGTYDTAWSQAQDGSWSQTWDGVTYNPDDGPTADIIAWWEDHT